MNRHFTFSACLLTWATLMILAGAEDARAQTVFINEVHYDNTGTDAGEAIEIAGPAGTNLAGWSLVLYNGNGGAPYNPLVALSGVIPDQQNGFGTLSFSYPVNGIQNGSPDGLALVDGVTVVQFLSYEGTFVAVGGPANGLASVDIGVSETGSEPLGQSLRLTGSGTTYQDFTWNAPASATFGVVNADQTFEVVVTEPVVLTCGSTLVVPRGLAGSRGVTAVDADGTVASFSISSVSPAPDGNAFAIEDVVPALGPGGSATAMLTVDAQGSAASYTVVIEAANSDGPTPQIGTCTLTVTIQVLLTIGEVQGVVGDADDGLVHRSPFAPPSGNGASAEMVLVQGLIYQNTLGRSSAGSDQRGFFMQSVAGGTDGDSGSSDGIFVFMGGFTDLIGGYVPQIGDEVILRARVTEFFNLTELTSASLNRVVRSGVSLDELEPFDAQPPDDRSEANRYWERHEGVRTRVAAQSLVLDGRNVFPSNLDSEVWVLHPDHPLAQRPEPYARRSFRDPHPEDNAPGLFDDGNGYRIVLGSLGIKAAASDNTALIAPARTFDRVSEERFGGAYFSFGKYQIQIDEQLEVMAGADPSWNSPPTPVRALFPWFPASLARFGVREFSIATFNVENLYDFRDDPFDACDFTGNSGCPGVSPPFDYVPASAEAYEERLSDLAAQLVTDLHSPALILVQEAEDQDICTVAAGSLTCGTMDNADGSPDTLQELALWILARGGPAYAAAYDRDGTDDRGIVSAFLYRTDRVQLLEPAPADPVLGTSPAIVYPTPGLAHNADLQNPKAVNAPLPPDVDVSTGVDGVNVFTRAPQVGLFRIWRNGIGRSIFIDLYVGNNHFSSIPNARVGQRTEQARYNAAIVDAIQGARPWALVAVGGDLNVFPRPDDPFVPGEPNFPSDQLAPLYEQGLGNLFDVLVQEVPASAYSYVFDGQAQTLDQLFVSPTLLKRLSEIRAAHINSDWPADHDDGPRGTSDHDPQVAKFKLVPTVPDLLALLAYLHSSGSLRTSSSASALAEALERTERFLEARHTRPAEVLVRALLLHLSALGPRHVRPDAAAALAAEVGALLDSMVMSLP